MNEIKRFSSYSLKELYKFKNAMNHYSFSNKFSFFSLITPSV